MHEMELYDDERIIQVSGVGHTLTALVRSVKTLFDGTHVSKISAGSFKQLNLLIIQVYLLHCVSTL